MGEHGPVVRRADGGLQVGVGPGAVVVRGPGDREAVRALGTALLGAGDVPAGNGSSRCPVLGHGPVAVRLRRALGEVPEDADAPVRVLVHQHVVPLEVATSAARDRSVCLPVVVQARRVVVGPLSGAAAGPCLHCLDLHRRDRDPSWPELATWLGHPAQQLEPVRVRPEVLGVVEGLVLLLVGSVLTGRATTPGLAHEVGPVPPHLVLRTWRRHPGCRWHPGGVAHV